MTKPKVKLMILAAGMGTRLGEIGKTTPKCLLEAGGKTLLEHILIRAKEAGIEGVVINTHHLAEKVTAFIKDNNSFDFDIEFSPEDPVLETGGGIKNAKSLLDDADIILIHNGDIYSDLSLKDVIEEHSKSERLATLCVSTRDSSRGLVFNQDDLLCGWANKDSGDKKLVLEPGENSKTMGFSGIYALSPKIFDYMLDESKFSIIDVFLKATSEGEKLLSMDVSDSKWFDSGTPEKLETLRNFLS